MARTADDSWDLASSVGATATMVAATRARASRGPDPVIDDSFAEPLVRAVGVEFFARLASGELTADDLGAGDAPTDINRFTNGMAARTRFFDDFFTDAIAAGIRQAVILASGLDARAWRLDWPADMVVFEIDQPEVIAFKSTTLAGLGAQPRADLRPVAVDLRADWPAALTAAGFDAGKPTAWIAEGLLGYLPPDAQDRLLDQIGELSAAGSRFAVEAVPSDHRADEDEVAARMQQIREQWGKHGFDLDFSELVYLGERNDVAEYLGARAWSVSTATANEILTAYGLPAIEDPERFPMACYLTATR